MAHPHSSRMSSGAALVALCRMRMRHSLGGRVGQGVGIIVVATTLGLAFAVSDSAPRQAPHELLTGAVRWLLWLAVGPLALSLAGNPIRRDRRDGIEMLAQQHGARGATLDVARTIAAARETARQLALPAVVLSSVVAVAYWRDGLAVVLVVAGVAVFSVGAGLCLGCLATACGTIGGRRGRWLLLSVVLLPWVLAHLAARPQWSVPGALDAALVFLAKPPATGGGG